MSDRRSSSRLVRLSSIFFIHPFIDFSLIEPLPSYRRSSDVKTSRYAQCQGPRKEKNRVRLRIRIRMRCEIWQVVRCV